MSQPVIDVKASAALSRVGGLESAEDRYGVPDDWARSFGTTVPA